MSQISKAVFGAIAVSLTLGAVQFASGHDLARSQQALNDTPVTAINRTTKTDRAAGIAGSAEQTQTISLRPESLADTSVLVRVPVVKRPETDARTSPAALAVQIRRSPQGHGGLRAHGQRADRYRKTAAARPLRDLSALCALRRSCERTPHPQLSSPAKAGDPVFQRR